MSFRKTSFTQSSSSHCSELSKNYSAIVSYCQRGRAIDDDGGGLRLCTFCPPWLFLRDWTASVEESDIGKRIDLGAVRQKAKLWVTRLGLWDFLNGKDDLSTHRPSW